jgi:hypothetical protein
MARAAAVVRGASGDDGQQLPRAHPVGGGARRRRVPGRPNAVGDGLAVPQPGVWWRQHRARHGALVGRHRGRPGEALRHAADAARPAPPAPAARQPAARRARRPHHRPPTRLLRGVAQPQHRRRPVLGGARLLGRGGRGERPGAARGWLVRHLPALDAPGPRRAGGGRPGAAADRRPVDAHLARTADRDHARGARLAARAPGRRPPDAAHGAGTRVPGRRRPRVARPGGVAAPGAAPRAAQSARRRRVGRGAASRLPARPLSLRPGVADAVARRAGAARARAGGRQPPARGARRRPYIHKRPARGGPRRDRAGERRAVRTIEPRVLRPLRPALRRPSSGPFPERVRRNCAGRPRRLPGARQRRREPGLLRALAHRPPVCSRPPPAPPGLERRAPPLRTQPEDPATASRLLAADQELFHDPAHVSALTLSVVDGSGG